MTFKGKEPIRAKIVLNNKITEQVSDFKYLVCVTSFYKNKDFGNELYQFQYICGSLNRILKTKHEKKLNLNSAGLWRHQHFIWIRDWDH